MERGILVRASFALIAVTLCGCGGGSGPSPAPPAPGPPGPPGPGPSPAPAPFGKAMPMSVVTYNLFWWCTSGVQPGGGGKWCPQYAGNKGFQMLFDKMKQFEPFDLIGLQECQDAQKMGDGIGYGTSHEWTQGPVDIGMGWNKAKFDKLGDYNSTIVGKDQYGDRYLKWIRLKFKGSAATVFFANTHGALPGPFYNCDARLAKNYIKAVADNIQPNDALVVTGDFNCLPQNEEIQMLNATWTLAANDRTTHFDHIYMKGETTRVDSWGDHNGSPSDHSILFANLSAKVPSADVVV